MATKSTTSTEHQRKSKVKRKGVHAKTKTSSSKASQNYVKTNKGQGK